MTQIPKNPFDREDWFSEVVKSNDSIMNSSQKALFEFQTKYNPQSMTKFQKVLTFFTTHTITAVVTASICLGGIATFAAQTVAPEQYKPSTVVSNLFKNNKIQQTNPNTPLVSDAQNDVISYNECGISIKYPKQLEGKSIGAFKDKPFGPEENEIISVGQIAKNQDGTSYLEINKIEPIIINCYTKGFNEITNEPQLLESKKLESRNLSNKEFQEITGWFISVNDKIKNITIEKNILDPSGFSPKIVTNILFEYENKFYQVNNSENLNLFSLNQIQIQFNNIANNIPNAEILKFDNVATGGFLFEYDKKLELKSKEKFEFSDPSKNNTFYVVNDKTLQDKISKLGLDNGDSIIFSGQVTNSNGKINLTKQEEFTITKIDKVEKLNNSTSSSKLGKIFGKLSYPSEGLPGVNVCAENVQTKNIICTDRVTGGWDINKPIDLNYSLELPVGEYELYSTAEAMTNYKAYYDEYSVCQNKNPEDNCYVKFPKPKIIKIIITAGSKAEISGWNWYTRNEVETATTSPIISPDGKNKLYYGGSATTPQGESVVRTDGPNTEEKNGLKIIGDLFVPKSQTVRATESIDEYSSLDCDIVPLKSYANNSNGQLFVSNANSYMSNGIGNDNSTPLRLNQLKDYIKTGNGEISNPINAFHSGCGGFATQFMKELGYTNKNGRQFRAVLVATGQEAIVDPMVYIFVQQGDKFAMMSAMSYSDVFEKCKNFGYASTNPNMNKYQNCMQDLMKNNSEVERFAKEKMQELLTSLEMN